MCYGPIPSNARANRFLRSLAIAFHNGTVSPVAAIAGSIDYQVLMGHFRDQSHGSQLERPWEFCRKRPHSKVKKSYRDVLYRLYDWVVSKWRSRLWPLPASPDLSAQMPEDPETLVLYKNIKKLLSSDNELNRLSLPYVGLITPEWLVEAQASKMRDAVALAGKTIGTLEYAPAAAFAAYGYPLCLFDSEWMPCPAPGRVMTLNFATDALTAALIPTPHFAWLQPTMRYGMNETLGLKKSTQMFAVEHEAADAMAEWIDGFVESRKPDKAILVGHLIDHPVFRKAINISRVSSLLVPNPKRIDPGTVIAIGAAKIMKDKMESQGEDCIERDECERIREKADQLAGSAFPSKEEYSRDRVEL